MKPFQPDLNLKENHSNPIETFDLKIIEVSDQNKGLTMKERMEKSDNYQDKLKYLEQKYKKGDNFNFHLEKQGNIYHIILDNIYVGNFAIRNKIDIKQISSIKIVPQLQNKGLGKQLYIKLNNYFNKLDGSVLSSDNIRTSDLADNLWQSLVKDGLAEKTDKLYAGGKNEIRFKSLNLKKDEK